MNFTKIKDIILIKAKESYNKALRQLQQAESMPTHIYQDVNVEFRCWNTYFKCKAHFSTRDQKFYNIIVAKKEDSYIERHGYDYTRKQLDILEIKAEKELNKLFKIE